MERLTKRRQDGRVGFAVSGTPSENMCKFPIVLDKLCEYEDLEEDGRLIRLPCKIGDRVYQPGYKRTKCTAYNYAPKYTHDDGCTGCEFECDSVHYPYIYVGKISEILIRSNRLISVKICFVEKSDSSFYTIGRNVFLSEEEAERNLINYGGN